MEQVSRIIGDQDWDGLTGKRLYVAMSALLCGLFFSVMDGTVCNVALPAFARELEVSSSDSIWIVNAFQLVIVMLLMPFAALGEVFSYRKVYLYGLVIFTLGSLFCGLSVSFACLVAARVVQGVGAAMVMSVNTSLVKLIYPKRHLGEGIGLNSTVVALGLVVGPAFTGAVLSWASWPLLFIVNVPFGIVAFLLARKSLPENPSRVEGRHFDFKEAVLNALMLGLFIGCFEAFSHKAENWIVGAGAGALLVVTWIFFRNQRRKEFPMFPLDLMHIPAFTLSVVTSVISFAAQMLALVAMPFMLAHTYGYDAGRTGMLMTAYPVVILVVAPLSGFLISRIRPTLLSAFGLLVLCVGSFLLVTLDAGSTFWDIAWRFGICGMGFGFFQSPNNHMILDTAPTHRAGSASGMLALARLMGQSLGAACVASFFYFFDDSAPLAAMFFGGILSLVGMLLYVVCHFRYR